MKDLSHHRKEANRRVIRSIQKEEQLVQTMPDIPPRKQTEKQLKKQAKQKLAQEKKNRPPRLPDLEERNKKMKERVPVIDRASAGLPKGTKRTQKKTPHL